MRDFGDKITIEVNNNVFLKDPESSELGRRIMSASISTIDELGFENFTFKKLAKEAKIYLCKHLCYHFHYDKKSWTNQIANLVNATKTLPRKHPCRCIY